MNRTQRQNLATKFSEYQQYLTENHTAGDVLEKTRGLLAQYNKLGFKELKREAGLKKTYPLLLNQAAMKSFEQYEALHDNKFLDVADRYADEVLKFEKFNVAATWMKYLVLRVSGQESKGIEFLEKLVRYGEAPQYVHNVLAQVYRARASHRIKPDDISTIDDFLSDVENTFQNGSRNDAGMNSSILTMVQWDLKSIVLRNGELVKSEISRVRKILSSFGLTDSIPNRIPLLIDLVDIAIEIENFKLAQRVEINDEYPLVLYQYTSFSTLAKILKLNEKQSDAPKFSLRLYNSDYMNDPEEGKVIFQYMNVESSKSNIFAGIESEPRRFEPSSIYLASLSELNPNDAGAMPMWNTYGDFHQGIALGLSVKQEEVFRNQILISGEQSVDECPSDRTVGLGLYHVLYLSDDPSKDGDHTKGARQQLARIGKKISQLDTNPVSQTEQEAISVFVENRLNQIRFLVKRDTFSYESEVRVVKEETFSNTLYDPDNPRLFVEIGNQPHSSVYVSLSQLVFGTNAESERLWLPIIARNFPNVEVGKSKQKFAH